MDQQSIRRRRASQSEEAPASLNTSLHSEQSEVTVLVSLHQLQLRRPLADKNNNSGCGSCGGDAGCCPDPRHPPSAKPAPQLPREEANSKEKCRSYVVLNSGIRKGRRGSLGKAGSVCCYLAPDGEAFNLTDWLRRVKALKNEFGGLEKQPPRLPTEAPDVRAVEEGLLGQVGEREYPVQSPGRGVRNHYCRYQVAGICRLWRKNCPFSHQQQLTTCKFWHAGFCMKGTDCPFLHGYVQQ